MSLGSETLFLEPNFHDAKVNLNTILEAWDEVQRYSVEVASTYSNATNIFEFSATECVYFACINRFFPKDAEGVAADDKKHHMKHPTLTHPNESVASSSAGDDVWSANAPWEDGVYEELDLPDGTSSKAVNHASESLPPLPSSVSSPFIATQAEDSTSTTKKARSETVGVIYLAPGQFDGEVNVGLALTPAHRGKGIGRETVSILLKWAFDEARYRRVQVALMEGPGRDAALKLFTGLGFVHEGTRRRQVFSVFSGEYKDVTYMALLDTEWFIRQYSRRAPNSMWDELFQRHQKEREELLEWDVRHLKMKRTQSMETVRMRVDDTASPQEPNPVEGGSRSVMADNASLEFRSRGPARNGPPSGESVASFSPYSSASANSPSPEDGWEMDSDCPASIPPDDSHQALWDSLRERNTDPFEGGASLPPPSEASSASGWEITSQASGSSASWDHLETSSVVSSGLQSIADAYGHIE